MTLDQAKHILRHNIAPDGSLSNPGGVQYLHWDYTDEITLDGRFSIEELTAIVTYISDPKEVI